MSADGTDDWTELVDDGFIGLVGPIIFAKPVDGVHRFRFTAERKHKNRSGFVQGGMLMTFADRCLGNTARAERPTRSQATMQFNIHFIRPVRIGETVEMRCVVVKETRTVCFTEGKILVGDEIVANVQGVWKIITVGPKQLAVT